MPATDLFHGTYGVTSLGSYLKNMDGTKLIITCISHTQATYRTQRKAFLISQVLIIFPFLTNFMLTYTFKEIIQSVADSVLK